MFGVSISPQGLCKQLCGEAVVNNILYLAGYMHASSIQNTVIADEIMFMHKNTTTLSNKCLS